MANKTNNIIYNNYDRFTGEGFSTTVVTTWIDGSPMDDSKVDNVIYFKNTTELGGGYSKKNCINDTIDLKSFGAISDGDVDNFTGTDNSTYLSKAIKLCSLFNLTLKINGKYAISPLFITNINGLTINFEPGSYIIGYPNMDINDRLLNFGFGANNIEINGYGSYIKTPVFTIGEQRHNVNITQASNLTINGLKCIGGGGDGYYIGSNSLPMPYNIILNDVSTDNARRNGLSIVSGINVIVSNGIFENSTGTLPMSGIDIEPNENIDEVLQGIRIINPTTRGNGDNTGGSGILCALASYVKNKEKTVDIVIENHISENDFRGVMFAGAGSGTPWGFKLNGEINYNGTILTSRSMGVFIVSWDKDKSPRIKGNAYIENPGDQDSNNRGKTGISIFAGGGSTFAVGNFDFNITVRDTRSIKKIYTAAYIENLLAEVSNYNLNIDYDNTGSFAYPIFNSSSQKNIGNVKFNNDQTIVSSGSISAGNLIRTTGATVEINASGSASLPISSDVLGQIFMIRSTTSFPVTIIPISPDNFFINDRSQTSLLRLTKAGEYIRLMAINGGWKAIDYYISFSGTTVNRPTVTNIGYPYFDITLGKTVWWNGVSWISAAEISETITGAKIFSGASALTTVNVQSTTNSSSESSGIRFQVRVGVGWDGLYQSLRFSVSDFLKPFVFANNLTPGSGEVARISGSGNLALGTTNPLGKLDIWQSASGIGTISTTSGSGTVTGVGTEFLNTFRIGQTITANGETRSVVSISSNTSMVTDVWTNTNSGINYTVIPRSIFIVQGNGGIGIGLTTPTSLLHIKAGTVNANTAPLKLTSGPLMITPEIGAIEFLTDGLYFTQTTGSTRQQIAFLASPTFTGVPLSTTPTTGDNSTKIATTAFVASSIPIAGSFSGTGTATTTFTVTIGSTQANNTYKVQVTPTNALSAALFYVNNKTTTTFDVVFLTGLTGGVAFDWALFK